MEKQQVSISSETREYISASAPNAQSTQLHMAFEPPAVQLK